MSVLSQFGSGGVKSVQRGTITLTNTVGTTTVTITAVNTSKSMVSYLGFTCSAISVDSNVLWTRIALTNSTTVTATRSFTNGTITVSYEVIEFY